MFTFKLTTSNLVAGVLDTHCIHNWPVSVHSLHIIVTLYPEGPGLTLGVKWHLKFPQFVDFSADLLVAVFLLEEMVWDLRFPTRPLQVVGLI